MSYIAARFDYDQELNNDKDLVNLYRVRDNDEMYKRPQNKGMLYSNNSIFSEDGRREFIVPRFIRGMLKPSNDPIWSSMTDEERIENGFITDFWFNYCASPKALIGLTLFSSINIIT